MASKKPQTPTEDKKEKVSAIEGEKRAFERLKIELARYCGTQPQVIQLPAGKSDRWPDYAFKFKDPKTGKKIILDVEYKLNYATQMGNLGAWSFNGRAFTPYPNISKTDEFYDLNSGIQLICGMASQTPEIVTRSKNMLDFFNRVFMSSPNLDIDIKNRQKFAPKKISPDMLHSISTTSRSLFLKDAKDLKNKINDGDTSLDTDSLTWSIGTLTGDRLQSEIKNHYKKKFAKEHSSMGDADHIISVFCSGVETDIKGLEFLYHFDKSKPGSGLSESEIVDLLEGIFEVPMLPVIDYVKTSVELRLSFNYKSGKVDPKATLRLAGKPHLLSTWPN